MKLSLNVAKNSFRWFLRFLHSAGVHFRVPWTCFFSSFRRIFCAHFYHINEAGFFTLNECAIDLRRARLLRHRCLVLFSGRKIVLADSELFVRNCGNSPEFLEMLSEAELSKFLSFIFYLTYVKYLFLLYYRTIFLLIFGDIFVKRIRKFCSDWLFRSISIYSVSVLGKFFREKIRFRILVFCCICFVWNFFPTFVLLHFWFH